MDEIRVSKYLGDIERYRKIFVIEDIYVIEDNKQDLAKSTNADGNSQKKIKKREFLNKYDPTHVD